MNKPLAIIAPQIGARSESFIRRHMEDLLPDGTVVIARTNNKPNAGYWNVDCPQLILNQVYQIGLAQKALRKVGRELHLRNSNEEWIAVKKFLTKHRVQVIMGEFLNICLPWLPLAYELGIPFYAHAHGYDVSALLRDPQWCKRYLQLNQAAGIITMNQPSRDRLIKIGINSNKIQVIPYGIDIPEQPISRQKKDSIRCLAIGRMVAKKAPILLLDAFRKATKVYPNLHLDYIGTGNLLPAVRQFILAFNLKDKVTLHEGKPHDFVLDMLQKADIFLQHSITDPDTGDEEGLPVAILEAMSYSLPVVSTRHAGIPEAVLDQETGYLVQEGDSTEMAKKLVLLAQNFNLRAEMGLASWHRARSLFSWEKEKELLLHQLNLME